MIQAYVDDSGHDGKSPVFLFSALIGNAEKWAKFSDDWNLCLHESPSIRYFKMNEAESCDGEFYGFSEDERNRKVKRLCSIMNSGDFTEFSYITPLKLFGETLKIKSGRPMSEPYFFAFYATIGGVAFEALGQRAKEPFEIFFDEQVIFGPRAKAWYPIIRAMAEDIVKAVLPVEPFFRKDIETMPLQAADLTAWMHRKANSSGLGEFEWLSQELSRLKRSPLSRSFNDELAHAILDTKEPTPESIEMRNAALRAYRETFGHEWPPKTKADIKQMRGRKRV
jgi:hypothetical protein